MERIYVTVRPKPLSPEDAASTPWKISGNSISISNHSITKFDFDRIFSQDCNNQQVYEARTRDIVTAAIRGFNGTVFAYGQTNSGKTHTMRGSAVEPGVIPLAVHDLFRIIQEGVDREFLLRMSYMEIYNEEINDLLAPEHRKLQIHENFERGIFVAGLREEIVSTPEQVLDFMQFGESHRHIGETNMNVYSSRSHTIFRMIIESKIKAEDDDIGTSCDAVRVSVLNLVDLAGSERAAKTGAEGVRLKEGSHINKSLMTLGTVIKKLSEGAESQGGHVPYRDSKLTRILQPSLGGNANTAIICNITLAQIHADETKSSLQFASRALRVTNCAHVNEILTDAALLKRQRKEIEDLRARLQGSHAEHFEEEILSLRNTLLQSELERERIALELLEEKKAQALRDRRLQEQAKKIENLSSMVLNSNVDEKRCANRKDKRRETWCPSVFSRETCREAVSTTQRIDIGKSIRPERDMGLPLPFGVLIDEDEPVMDHIPQDSFTLVEHDSNGLLDDCILPDARSLLNVTNRRKVPTKKSVGNNMSVGISSVQEQSNEPVYTEAECGDLFIKFESQRIIKDIEINYLMEKLAVEGHHSGERNSGSSICQLKGSSICQLKGSTCHGDKSLTLRESEVLLVIKQLEDQVKMLEMDRSLIQQNLDTVTELAIANNISSVLQYEELYQEFLLACSEAKFAQEELHLKACVRNIEENNVDLAMELLTEVEGLELGVQSSRNSTESICSVVDELFQCFSTVSDMFLGLKSFACQNAAQMESMTIGLQKICNYMENKAVKLESDKSNLFNQSINLHKQIEELGLSLQEAASVLTEHCQQHDSEKAELLSHIGNLEKEISRLSYSSLAREKETLRKEVEKTKLKLKEADFKLKNCIQEKTKLEGEKAQAEREIKLLHGQKILLERDICKRDSLAVRRRDSLADKSRESKAFDSNKSREHSVQFEQCVQGEYKKLEVLAFEMETTIASLEEELAAVNGEKEAAFQKNGSLVSELEATSDQLSVANSELKTLQEEVSSIRNMLVESQFSCQKTESSVSLLQAEKEELAMQLTDALLELDEEKAIWASKEKASIESIAKIAQVGHELESCREECKVLRERLSLSEENVEWERKLSHEKSSEIDQLRHDLNIAESEIEKCYNERDKLLAQNEELQKLMIEVEILRANNDDLLLKARAAVEEMKTKISNMDIEMHNITVKKNNETAKLTMRARSTQAKLDAFRGRYSEAIDEMSFMNKKFEEAAGKLKEQLASYAVEVLHLKKLLAAKED